MIVHDRSDFFIFLLFDLYIDFNSNLLYVWVCIVSAGENIMLPTQKIQ